MNQFKKIFSISQPITLLLVVLTYILGAGVSRYLGASINIASFFIGLGWIFLLLFTSRLLAEYFRLMDAPLFDGEKIETRLSFQTTILQVAAVSLTTIAALTVIMMQNSLMNIASIFFLSVYAILSLVNSLPPFLFSNRGYGELIVALLLASLSPVIAFVLQTGEFNRVLPLVTFPLTLLALIYLLAMDFPSYAGDLKYRRFSLLIRLTWQKAVPVHNVLIVSAYLLFALTPFFGLPWQVIWPAFLTLPLAMLQIFWLRNITNGAKPVWSLWNANATALIGLTAYFLALTFWIR